MAFEKDACSAENRIEHLFGQSSREGVLLTGVIRADESEGVGDPVLYAMREFWPPPLVSCTELGEGSDGRVESHFPQSHNHAHAAEQFHFGDEVWPAIPDLFRTKLILWRCATARRRDVAIEQPHPVIAGNGIRLARESCFVKGTIQPVTAPVACEHTTCSVSSMCRRSKPNEKKLCPGISKSRIRFSPVVPLCKPPCLLACDLFPPADKPWAQAALDDLLLEVVEFCHLEKVIATT